MYVYIYYAYMFSYYIYNNHSSSYSISRFSCSIFLGFEQCFPSTIQVTDSPLPSNGLSYTLRGIHFHIISNLLECDGSDNFHFNQTELCSVSKYKKITFQNICIKF